MTISHARAHWVAPDLILWDVPVSPQFRYVLYADSAARIELPRFAGEHQYAITLDPAPAPAQIAEAFPHLAGYPALRLEQFSTALLRELVRCQLVVALYDQSGALFEATGLQLPGLLDALFPYDGPLGLTVEAGLPMLRVWAPTARAVRLQRYASGAAELPSEVLPMELDAASGVWGLAGEPSWFGEFYLFEVEVFAPSVGSVVKNLVTDPYSLSLSSNSARSQFVDLSSPELKPDGWDSLPKPLLESPADIVLYELHVRDFSIFDESVPPELCGTFRAFTLPDSIGVRHLRELAEAGVSHVHLLPVFDVATIEEQREQQIRLPLEQLAAFPPDSAEQQALLYPIRDRDGFNWGYDPFHYTVPEGSYATDAHGTTRITEFRQMVQALHGLGLRVVMDVVYNHTNDHGQGLKSVLDKIVPGYYHRLDQQGAVTNSTCCSNTASEHAMMEKLMIDSLLTWAIQYKVDGFRFDLMGHHLRRNLLKLRAALDSLTLEQHGVDGKAIYVYGEGWDFGEVAQNARGVNATQWNMAGTGIGTFSDRLRDAVRGGSAFSGVQEQGFVSGLHSEPNGSDQGDNAAQRLKLLQHTDLIKLGLAGNLRDYSLINYAGNLMRGDQLGYSGVPAGYAQEPFEQIVYVSAHDNETLFDAIQLKAAPETPVAERGRMQMLALSLVALSQGIPFFHAGDELLRSKSLDRNSFNSSDWFNQIDWSGQRHTFGVGLPPAADNALHWPLMRTLLANPMLRPDPETILACKRHLLAMLRIRRSSPLFRLRSAADVQRIVHFLNHGPAQIPGLIVMLLNDSGPQRIDPVNGQIVVLFNANPAESEFQDTRFAQAELQLHPAHALAEDPCLALAQFDSQQGIFRIPARTTAVFVGPASLPDL